MQFFESSTLAVVYIVVCSAHRLLGKATEVALVAGALLECTKAGSRQVIERICIELRDSVGKVGGVASTPSFALL